MKKLAICGVAAAALLLTSCGSTKVEETLEPAFTTVSGTWESTEFVVDGNPITGATATITFEAPTFNLAGNNGVNNYFGTVKIDGVSFDATESLGQTMMAGSEEAMAFADKYMAALVDCDTIGRAGNKLVAKGPESKIVYVFNGKEFETESVTYKGENVKGAKATLMIMPVYHVSGCAGVNNYMGEVALLEGQFNANTEEFNLGMTKKMGPKEAMDFEAAFINLLSEAKTLDFDADGYLVIASDNGKICFNGINPISIEE